MEATYGLAGHGLLLAPSPACGAIVTADRELVMIFKGREAARITPGVAPATGAGRKEAAEKTVRYGEGGPTLEYLGKVRPTEVFFQIDADLPPSDWSALAPGFTIELPVGVVLLPAPVRGGHPYFELHAPSGADEYISFQTRPVPASEIVVNPAPNQRLVERADLDREGEVIRFTRLAYKHGGVAWNQVFYAVPLDDESSVIVMAQAVAARAEPLFGAAEHVASTLMPFGADEGQGD